MVLIQKLRLRQFNFQNRKVNMKVNNKVSLQVSGELQRTCERNERRSLFPSINNENHYQTDQFEQHYCIHSNRVSQPKGTTMPLTLREYVPNDSQQPQDQGKKGVSQKKMNRPWAAKSKYSSRKGSKEKKSDHEEKEELKYTTRKSNLEKLKLKSIEIPSFTAGLFPEMAITTLHLDKVLSCSIPPSHPKSSFRDRTNSCKVAIKKVFPQAASHEKKSVQKAIDIFFEREEQKLSTIPGGCQDDSFLSMESYSQLIF